MRSGTFLHTLPTHLQVYGWRVVFTAKLIQKCLYVLLSKLNHLLDVPYLKKQEIQNYHDRSVTFASIHTSLSFWWTLGTVPALRYILQTVTVDFLHQGVKAVNECWPYPEETQQWWLVLCMENLQALQVWNLCPDETMPAWHKTADCCEKKSWH